MTQRRRLPPSSQDLVAEFGGYDKITPEAWAEWDRANVEWQAEYRRELAAQAQQARRPRSEAAE